MDRRHPLVIALVIAVIGIGFCYFSSPYENCKREYMASIMAHDTDSKISYIMGVFRKQSNW